MDPLKENIIRTLLYYDIFKHPLKPDEIFSLLPQNSITKKDVSDVLLQISKENPKVSSKENYYFIGGNEDYTELF